MKTRLSFAISLASAAMLSASVIEWDLPTLANGNDDPLAFGTDASNIVFLLWNESSYDSATGVYTPTGSQPNGSNSVIDQDDEYIAATWTDDNTSGGTYIMAFYDPSTSTYYSINNGNGDPITVPTSVNENYDPLIPGSTSGAVATFDSTSLGSTAHTVSRTAGSGSTPVPEPATAALALAGVALLLRRRKA